MLMNAFTTVCVFSGLGFIAGSGVANLTGDWRWALRVRTPSRLSKGQQGSTRCTAALTPTLFCLTRSPPSSAWWGSSCWRSRAPTRREALLRCAVRGLWRKVLTLRMSSTFWKSRSSTLNFDNGGEWELTNVVSMAFFASFSQNPWQWRSLALCGVTKGHWYLADVISGLVMTLPSGWLCHTKCCNAFASSQTWGSCSVLSWKLTVLNMLEISSVFG